jgi:predicted P-loop ATPase
MNNDQWKDGLLVNDKGMPKALFANAVVALRDAPAWLAALAFDDFAKRSMLVAAPPWETYRKNWKPRPWTEHDDLLTNNWLQHERIAVSLSITQNAVELVAMENRYHPIRDYLDGIKWDCIDRLDGWLSKYCGAVVSDYTSAVSRCILIGAVARLYNPGCKVDNVPIFEGLQGVGKSTMAEAMFSPWFTDDMPDLGSKDGAMQTAGVWMIELGELDAMSRGEVSKIKAFIARKVDRFRPPYGRRVIEFPRQCVFWGTTNGTGYLKDETGARRYWPIECGKLDVGGLREVRDQLWAEACQRYRDGKAWWIAKPDVLSAAEEQQADRYCDDVWTDDVITFIDPLASTTIPDILRDGLSVPTERLGQVEMNRVARILRANGWVRFQKRDEDGRRQWRYQKKESPRLPALVQTKF